MVLWESDNQGGVEPTPLVGLTILFAMLGGVIFPVGVGVVWVIYELSQLVTFQQGICLGVVCSWVWLAFLWLRYRYLNKVSRVKHEINRSL